MLPSSTTRIRISPGQSCRNTDGMLLRNPFASLNTGRPTVKLKDLAGTSHRSRTQFVILQNLAALESTVRAELDWAQPLWDNQHSQNFPGTADNLRARTESTAVKSASIRLLLPIGPFWLQSNDGSTYTTQVGISSIRLNHFSVSNR